MENTQKEIQIRFCNIDRLFYIYSKNPYSGEFEEIHHQQQKPTEEEIKEAVKSDEWKERFEDMRNGKRVRVSERIYWDIFGCVPPIRQTKNSFFCGEMYSENMYHFFEKKDGFCFGSLKNIKEA